METGPRPCIPAGGTCCVAGLLLGAACCPDGNCSLCRATADRMRRSGFADPAIRRSLARTRRGLLDRCPSCGCPPPTPLDAVPPLPRLDRSDRVESNAWACRVCGNALTQGRRQYCSDHCYEQAERVRQRG